MYYRVVRGAICVKAVGPILLSDKMYIAYFDTQAAIQQFVPLFHAV